MVKGSCLCGKIKYELTTQGQFINNCHCTRCRKASGAAFGSFLHISRDYFKWLQGEECLQIFESSPNVIRTFCKVCGSRMPAVLEALNHVAVPAGTLDDDPNLKPIVNIYTGSKAPWYTISDEIPGFEEQPPPEEFLNE